MIRPTDSAMPVSDKPVTVLVADDHPVFRQGLCDILRRNTPYEIAGEADNGEEALRLIRMNTPRVAILDVEMPKMNGI